MVNHTDIASGCYGLEEFDTAICINEPIPPNADLTPSELADPFGTSSSHANARHLGSNLIIKVREIVDEPCGV
jgi:hypothetical protein